MKKSIRITASVFGVFVLFALSLTACQQAPESAKVEKKLTKADLKTDMAKLSYALGADISRKMKRSNIEFDPAFFYEGLKAGLADETLALMTNEEIHTTLENLRQDQLQKRQASQDAKAKENIAIGEKFLAAKEKEEGVVKLPSGLLYKIEKAGTGASPKADDTIECHYRGTTIDGNEFDSSYKRNKPAKFRVDRVIKGWTEAIQKMKVGGKWQLFVPSSLAYGNRAMGQKIPPGSTLVFDVELLGIEPKK